MANRDHLEILNQGVETWNKWREENPTIIPNLEGACLREASLWKVNLKKADLREADLWEADLRQADLRQANLCGISLRGADLWKANLCGADLQEAKLEGSIFIETNLEKANLTWCKIYGISAWAVKLDDETVQKDLIITTDNDPAITVDSLEIAQFIHMLINNEKLRSVIDTMRTKTVLILGKFDNKTMPVLERIKEELRTRGFIPMMFTFDVPEKQFHIDTVKTMALLSSFVIIDLSIPGAQLYELGKMIDNARIPFIPILHEEAAPSDMLSDCLPLPWYKSDYESQRYSYENADKQISELLDNTIIPWAEKTNVSLKRIRDEDR